MPNFDHLNASAFIEVHEFKSTLTVKKPSLPQPDREQHGNRLLKKLGTISSQVAAIKTTRHRLGLPNGLGMTVAVEVFPAGAIDTAKLEWKRDGIEVLNVIPGEDRDIVALHVPDGKIGALEKRIKQYISEDTKWGKPKNANLVNALADIRKANFLELWTDKQEDVPPAENPSWFQVWVRTGKEGPAKTHKDFLRLANQFDIFVESGYVSFPGRTVVAAHARRVQLEKAIDLLDHVAEIRGIKPTADFFLSDLKPFEQAEWIRDLQKRTVILPETASTPYVTILDTGVTQPHPLIKQFIDATGMHAVEAAWATTDLNGHGTQMAGVVLHGNLSPLLAHNNSHSVPHRLESVKILPDKGQNPSHLYGAITNTATDLVETAAPTRQRIYAMMTTVVGGSTGAPTEWSATIDRLSFGRPSADINPDAPLGQVKPRLFVMSTGNIPWPKWKGYPNSNDLSAAEDPSQSWNAISVGAATELVDLNQSKWPSLKILAAKGALAPMSTTSIVWGHNWPIKPDVVAEGGNGCIDDLGQITVGPEDLRILTTSNAYLISPLVDCGGTSPAAAEVARICAHLTARYPLYWPETIRALIVHGAQYTQKMHATLPLNMVQRDKQNLLRRFGYGQANLDRSIESTNRRATLVLQEKIIPYIIKDSGIKLGAMNLHALPWPSEALEAIAEKTVEMKVTLSYFIEPNPARRGWQSKFRYQSHGLRFAVKGSTESEEEFLLRINKIEREALAAEQNVKVSELESMSDPDLQNWFFGPRLRVKGSLHLDHWRGSAAQLREKSHIAVFPVGGWWKDWKEAQRADMAVRYSLVVSLEVMEDVEIDIYTPIATAISAAVSPVEIDIQ